MILNVSVEVAGTYRCLLSNVVGEIFQDIQVTVKGTQDSFNLHCLCLFSPLLTERLCLHLLFPPSAPPDTSVEPSSVEANVHCQVTFQCLDRGLPPGSFQWLFDGVPVRTRPGLQVRGTGELLLSELQLQDAGNYSCTVHGSLQDITDTAVLTVIDPLFAPGSPAFPPNISSPTPSVQALAVHQAAQFVCLVDSFPPPRIVWLKDGEPLPNYRRVTNVNESVGIRDLRVTDSATYECVASNALGEETRAFRLEVGGLSSDRRRLCMPHQFM